MGRILGSMSMSDSVAVVARVESGCPLFGCETGKTVLEFELFFSVVVSEMELVDGEKGGRERAITLSLSSSLNSVKSEADCVKFLSLSHKIVEVLFEKGFIGSWMDIAKEIQTVPPKNFHAVDRPRWP
ncbi:hypothetical protein CAJAP_10458 [Camponotus japonicus]